MNGSRTVEHLRLEEIREKSIHWRLWGPYLSEREWGTVREDYSSDGNAWQYVTHDQARSRAYRWGEDGIAGISDDKQRLCFALAFWNGNDPIIKERLFGLTNAEGNHGEDVKEYYFYLDNLPTHSYMKYLYKYPQQAFPYNDLVRTNQQRSGHDREYELIDTGAFSGNKYFDIFIEYAKASPEDMLICITVCNRQKQPAILHILPTIWFRNTWKSGDSNKPMLFAGSNTRLRSIVTRHPELGEYSLFCDGEAQLLFTENETNEARIFGHDWRGYAKDGINDYIVQNNAAAVNDELIGSKAAAHYNLRIPGGEELTIRLRLSSEKDRHGDPFRGFDKLLLLRQQEADEFYDTVIPSALSKDEANVMRQGLAGMLWTKQYYNFNVERWIEDHDESPTRNTQWFYMASSDIISMPDKWEYPWYAAWDLAFHTIPLSLVDLDFAKKQLDLILSDVYLHPNGQVPAYEWNFSDVNPPVHAWAALTLSEIEREERGKPDYAFLKIIFTKLLLNFTWWVNRKDEQGKNVFQGGFLGLDNIGLFDRSSGLPRGGHLEQADGTAWMALFCQNMLQIAMELAMQDSTYIEMSLKFVEHFLWIAAAMDHIGVNQDEMWDEEDGFFYDVFRLPNGLGARMKVRSVVGLLPLCATTVLEESALKRYPETIGRVQEFLKRHPKLLVNIAPPTIPGYANRRLLAIVNENKLRRILARMLDENEFFSPHGIRSVSLFHKDKPYILNLDGAQYAVQYSPAESENRMFGGNSNWRGPVWFPLNFMILRALHQFYLYYGDKFRVECPTGSGRLLTLYEVAAELGQRLNKIFLRDDKGRRPVYGGTEIFQTEPLWRDLILFYEYFHGDNGAGIGASHQTGWTGLVARLLQIKACATPESILHSTNAAQVVQQSKRVA
ncbi:MAG TPA: glucosidase [Terriglobales bacterium]|nr:glucosidase [Terriglobales bacterium]